MVKQGIDQRSVKISCGGMDDQAGRLVDYQEMLVFEDDLERNILWFIVRRCRLRHGDAKSFSSANLGRGIADRLAPRFDSAAADQGLQSLTGEGWNSVCECTIQPPTRMDGLQANIDRLMTPHKLGYGFGPNSVQCRPVRNLLHFKLCRITERNEPRRSRQFAVLTSLP